MKTLEWKTSGAYAPVPWHNWNGEMKNDVILHQFDELKAQGIWEIIIFPCYGLEIEYLSEAWFDKVKFAVEAAKERRLKLWIYDDLNWPSGNCGGKLIKEKPWLKEVGMRARRFRVEAGKTVNIESSGPIIAVFAGRNNNFSRLQCDHENQRIFSWANEIPEELDLYIFEEKVMDRILPSFAPFEMTVPNF